MSICKQFCRSWGKIWAIKRDSWQQIKCLLFVALFHDWRNDYSSKSNFRPIMWLETGHLRAILLPHFVLIGNWTLHWTLYLDHLMAKCDSLSIHSFFFVLTPVSKKLTTFSKGFSWSLKTILLIPEPILPIA